MIYKTLTTAVAAGTGALAVVDVRFGNEAAIGRSTGRSIRHKSAGGQTR